LHASPDCSIAVGLEYRRGFQRIGFDPCAGRSEWKYRQGDRRENGDNRKNADHFEQCEASFSARWVSAPR
jgi:hypothetical protein